MQTNSRDQVTASPVGPDTRHIIRDHYQVFPCVLLMAMKRLGDNIEFEEILEETFTDLAKTYGTAAAEHALEGVSDAVRGLAADTVGVFMGAVAKFLFQTLVRHEATVAAKLDVLIREPAVTGIAVGMEALSGAEDKRSSIAFKQRRLQFAIEKLDVARTLSGPKRDMQFVLVTLLQGFLLTQIDGGLSLATARFAEVLPFLLKRVETLSKKADCLRARADEADAEAAIEQRKDDHYGERRVDVFIHPETYGRQAAILRDAASLNYREYEQAQAALAQLKQVIELIDAYVRTA